MFRQLLVLLVVCAGYMFFRAPTMTDAGYVYAYLFTGWGELLHLGVVINALHRMGITDGLTEQLCAFLQELQTAAAQGPRGGCKGHWN